MSNFLKPLTEEERQARYRVTVASRTLPGPKGLGYESSGTRGILLWNQISHIVAAEVGEPEGVRAVVFDLLSTEDAHGRRHVSAMPSCGGPENDGRLKIKQ